MAAFPSACMASYDLPEVLGLISHLAQTFWISSYLSETPSRLPHPHPGCFRTDSGSLFSPFLAWPILFVKEALPSTYPVTCLSVCLPNFHSFSCLSSLQPIIHQSTPDSSVHTYIHMSTQSSTSLLKYPPIYSIHISICLPKHPPICLPIHLTIHPSIPLPTDTYPPTHLSTYPPSLPSQPPSISLPTHPLIYLYPYTRPPILSHLPTHHPCTRSPIHSSISPIH